MNPTFVLDSLHCKALKLGSCSLVFYTVNGKSPLILCLGKFSTKFEEFPFSLSNLTDIQVQRLRITNTLK